MRALLGVGLLVSLSASAATLDITGSTLTFTLAPSETGGMSATGATLTFTASAAITRTGSGTGFNAGSSFGGNLATAGVTSVVVNGGTVFSINNIDTPMPASLTVATSRVNLVNTLRTDGRNVAFTGSGELVFGDGVTVARTYTIDTDAVGGTSAAGSIIISLPESDPYVGGNIATVILDASADGSGAPGNVRVMGRLGGYVNTGSVSVKGKDVRLGAVYVFGRFDLLSRTVELTGPIRPVAPGNGFAAVAAIDDGAEIQLAGTGTSAWHLDAAELSHLLSGPNPWFALQVGRFPAGGNVTVQGDITTGGALYLSGAVVNTTGGVLTLTPPNRFIVQAARHIEVGSIIGANDVILFGDEASETTTQTAPIVTRTLDVFGTASARLLNPGNDVNTLRVSIFDGGSFAYSQTDGFDVPRAEVPSGSLRVTSGGAITSTFVTGDTVDINAAAFSFYFANATTSASFVVDEFTFAPQSPGGGVGGTAVASIRPRTPGRPVFLGGPLAPNPAALSLSRWDVASFAPTLATLTIGAGSPMSVDGAITLFPPTTLVSSNLALAHHIDGRRTVELRATSRLAADAGISASTLTIDGSLDLETSSLVLDGGLAFTPSSTLRTRVNGANEVGHMSVNGSLDLTNASLEVLGTFNPPVGSRVRLITNDGNDAVVGTFAGLMELGDASFNGTRVTYVDDGHNVSLIKFSNPTGLSLAGDSVPEFKPVGTVVGTLNTIGSEGESRAFTFVSGAGDTDNQSFSITGSQLTTAATFDFEDGSTRTIRVASTDELGLSVEQALTVTIVDNLAPVFTASPKISASPAMPLIGSSVQFTAPTMDAEGDVITTSYDYGDGTTGTTGVHTFTTAGTFIVKVTASDPYASSSAELILVVAASDITLEAANGEHPLAKLPGCGCSSGDAFSVLSLGLLALLRRRSRA